MCLGIPAKVITTDGLNASVEIGGVKRDISLMLIDGVTPGEWVVIHAGFAINRVDPEEAEKTLELLKELGDGDQIS